MMLVYYEQAPSDAVTGSFPSLAAVDQRNSENAAASANLYARADLTCFVPRCFPTSRNETGEKGGRAEGEKGGSGNSTLDPHSPPLHFSPESRAAAGVRGGTALYGYGAAHLHGRRAHRHRSMPFSPESCRGPKTRHQLPPCAHRGRRVAICAHRCLRTALIDSEFPNGCGGTTCCYKKAATGQATFLVDVSLEQKFASTEYSGDHLSRAASEASLTKEPSVAGLSPLSPNPPSYVKSLSPSPTAFILTRSPVSFHSPTPTASSLRHHKSHPWRLSKMDIGIIVRMTSCIVEPPNTAIVTITNAVVQQSFVFLVNRTPTSSLAIAFGRSSLMVSSRSPFYS
ncbi:hypothetical protein MRX96_027760 [Rhipicephalus microplus]